MSHATIEQPKWSDAHLDEMRSIGDPVADRVVRDVFADGDVDEVRRLLRRVLDHDDAAEADLPEHVRGYLESLGNVPAGTDLDRLARGQRVFQEFGVPISVALFCASLPSAYACAKGVHVLAQTARLETDTRRRIMETGQFLVDALGPRGLEPSGPGILAIQRVRLMHAAVRALIDAHHRADPTSWDPANGTPINQEDLAGTLLSFSYTVVEPLPRLGIDLAAAEQADYLYVWEVIGAMLGLRADMIPRSIDESTTLVTAIRRRQYGRSADGVVMANALIELLREMTPIAPLRRSIPDLIRLLSGDEVARILQLPEPARHYGWTRLVRVWLRLTTHEAENHRVLRSLATHVGWFVLRGMLDVERQGEHRADFDIPDELANHWRLHDAPD
ncbi:MAG: oxygenase MpaB family protein [Actinomycetota bacterium]